LSPDWWVYEPGTPVRCPVCLEFLAVYGASLRAFVRRHPQGRAGQKVPAPTTRQGESRPCVKCRNPMELRLEMVGESARVA
jgi:hypothetical protein